MRFALKVTIILLTGLSFFSLVSCAVVRPIGQISVRHFTLPLQKTDRTSSQEAANVELTAYITGWVLAPANILIDQDAPNLPEHLRKAQWVPSIVYAVRHPDLGVAILDTGLHAGECEYGLRPIYWVPCRNAPGSDLVTQLRKSNIDPKDIRYVIPSHYHGDHISGLDALLSYTNAPLLATSEALKEFRSPIRFAKGIPSNMLRADKRVELIDSHWEQDPMVGHSFDVFGEGSLRLFRSAGHTDGHLSAVIETGDNTVLLTFDAAHLQANFELEIPSGSVASHDDAMESLALMQQISASTPNLTIIFGHEPTQWDCKSNVVKLPSLGENCSASPIYVQ